MRALDVSETELAEGVVSLALSGELDVASAHWVGDELRRIEERRPRVLVLDLRELRFMDSTGLRILLEADRRARAREARLVVVRGPETVHRVFRIARLDERLELVDHPARIAGGGDGPGPPSVETVGPGGRGAPSPGSGEKLRAE